MLSVVIPCLNAAATIGGQLEALTRQEWREGWEVIVADNGSTDETRDVIARYQGRLPGLQIVDASARRGSAHARNVGAKFASGEAILFCDADDEVGVGWLTAMGSALRTHDFVANRTDVQKLNPPWIANNLRNAQGSGLQRVAYPPYLQHAGGSGLGVKRATHKRVGGFDERLLQLEDTDYCFRIQLREIDLRFVPDAVMHVRYSTDPASLFRQARRWAKHNMLMYKRYGAGQKMTHPWIRHLESWTSLLRCATKVIHHETRAVWMKGLGTQLGLLEGAIRYRVPPVR